MVAPWQMLESDTVNAADTKPQLVKSQVSITLTEKVLAYTARITYPHGISDNAYPAS